MEFSQTINKRRSCRRYTNKPVPPEVIEKALNDALKAPNTSNIQPWEFYWVQTPTLKNKLVKACMNQGAARTAQELIVAVANRKTWNRNRILLLEVMKNKGKVPKVAIKYYEKLIPVAYIQGPFNLFGYFKKALVWIIGWFTPVPRGPNSKSELTEVLSKTVALACENFMLSVVDQGYGCCPMEGFDAHRVRRILGLKRSQHIVMVISVGEVDPDGIWGEQIRLTRELFVKKV